MIRATLRRSLVVSSAALFGRSKCEDAEGYKAQGLLIGADKSSQHFSTAVPVLKVPQVISDRRYFDDLAVQDTAGTEETPSAYVTRVCETAGKYVNSNELCGHEKLRSELLRVINSRHGLLVCLLGGKDSGKSFLLSNLSQEHADQVFVAQMGLRSEIVPALLESFRKNYDSGSAATRSILEGALRELAGITNPYYKISFEDVLALVFEQSTRISLHQILQALAKSNGGKPITLVLDGCQIPLTVSACSTPEDIQRVKRDLNMLVYVTKDTKLANVVLVSSDHQFPNRLRDSSLRFNLLNIHDFMYAGELSPHEMYSLLTEKWGAGPMLAHGLVDKYGGHHTDTHEALEQLKSGEDVDFSTLTFADVLRCLQWDGGLSKGVDVFVASDNKLRMRSILTELAQKGVYALRNPADPAAAVLAQNHVDGVVMRSARHIEGVPRSVWTSASGCRWMVVPVKQTLRLVIAETLADEEEYKEYLDKLTVRNTRPEDDKWSVR